MAVPNPGGGREMGTKRGTANKAREFKSWMSLAMQKM